MRRIVHLITTLNRGGAEKQLLTLITFQIKQGDEVFVIPLRGSNDLEYEFQKRGAVVISDLLGFNFCKQFLRFRFKILGKLNPELIHAHLPRAEVLAVISTFLNRVRIIVSKHNSERFWPYGPRVISKLLSWIVNWNSSGIICISYAVKSFLVEIGEIPKSPDKVRVVHYGYEWQRLTRHSDREVSSSIEGSRSRPFVFSLIGRLVEQKRIDLLIKSIHLLLQSGLNVEAKVIGIGPLEDKLKDYCTNLGVDSRVNWLGGNYSDPFLALGRVHALVLCSSYEGFGLVLLEAVDRNLPIIATKSPAVVEVLGNQYPYLAESGDAESLSEMMKLVINPEKDLKAEYALIKERFDASYMNLQMNLNYYHFLGAV